MRAKPKKILSRVVGRRWLEEENEEEDSQCVPGWLDVVCFRGFNERAYLEFITSHSGDVRRELSVRKQK